jgi:hypothetical protein
MQNNFATVNASTWLANNIVQCGATPSTSGNPSTWTFQSYFAANSSLPCGRTSIVTDPACNCQVLQFQLLTSDTGGSGYKGALTWPWKGTQGSNSTWLPNAYYAKLTFRYDTQSLIQGGPGHWGDNSWFSTPGDGGHSTWLDENIGENTNNTLGDGQNTGTLTQFGGGYWEWYVPGGGNNLFGGYNPTLNMSIYHTIEVLWTNNGSSSAYVCEWLDANGNYTGPGYLGCNGGSLVNSVNYSEHDRIMAITLGAFGGAITNTATAYIQDYEVWVCPSFISSTCSSTVIASWPP